MLLVYRALQIPFFIDAIESFLEVDEKQAKRLPNLRLHFDNDTQAVIILDNILAKGNMQD